MARGRPSRATVYARLEAALAELRDRLGGLPSPKESEAIWADIWHLEAHHSTALEGNTLVLREVEFLLERGKAVGAKPLKEYMEVKGYGDAAQWVYAQALEPGDWHDGGLVSIQELRHIHKLAMDPVWQVAPHPDATDQEGPGNFRRHDIRPFGGGMTPPDWPLVDAHVRGWVEAVNDRPGPGDTHAGEACPDPRPLRADPPVHRRERKNGPTGSQPPPRPPGIPTDRRAEAAAVRVPDCTAEGGRR